jgi:hypothetical protein
MRQTISGLATTLDNHALDLDAFFYLRLETLSTSQRWLF